jgi:ZIP family zinc transporter
MVLDNVFIKQKNVGDIHKKVAIMTAIGLMVHNLPEGMIMGCGFVAAKSLGFKMSIIISLHDIPEGLAIAAPLMVNKVKPRRILLYAFITALPTALGLWIGILIGAISPNVLGACLSIASGIMLYVVCDELVPEATNLWAGLSTSVGILSGILLGMIITQVI